MRDTVYTCDFCGFEDRTDEPRGWSFVDVDLCPLCAADRQTARAQIDHELRHMPRSSRKEITISLGKRT